MIDISYGIAKTIGRRSHMEDTHAVRRYESLDMFTAEVYDGHSGALAATIAAEFLTDRFVSLIQEDDSGTSVQDRLTAEKIRRAYLDADEEITARSADSGAAAATFYLCGNRFLVANAGDTRIVVGDGPSVIQLTEDHRPGSAAEGERIAGLGGAVTTYDVPRVQGLLSLSRALGDFALKPYVTPEPRVVEGFLGNNTDVAVLASDGVWDVLTSEDAIALARAAKTPTEGALSIQEKATEQGSTDNMTIIVLNIKLRTLSSRRPRLEITRTIDFAKQIPGAQT